MCSRHRVNVDWEQSHACSSKVDFHLLFILCTDLTHSQVDVEIEVAGEKATGQDLKEAETEV